MEDSFKGLYLYEEVMLILGIILFAILCVGLIYYIIKKEDIKKLLLFFIVAIIMMAYPSIQEIQIEKDKIALKKYSNEILDNPEDPVARNELSRVAEKLEKRASTPEDYKVLSEAHLLLGNSDKAIGLAEEGIASDENNPPEVPSAEPTGDDASGGGSSTAISPKTESLKRIQDIALVQKSLQEQQGAVQDTAMVREAITKVQWNNPKTATYLNKQLRQNETPPQ